MKEFEALDVLYQRDQGIGAPYPDEATEEDIYVVCGEYDKHTIDKEE